MLSYECECGAAALLPGDTVLSVVSTYRQGGLDGCRYRVVCISKTQEGEIELVLARINAGAESSKND